MAKLHIWRVFPGISLSNSAPLLECMLGGAVGLANEVLPIIRAEMLNGYHNGFANPGSTRSRIMAQ
jgi:hypothetical protein